MERRSFLRLGAAGIAAAPFVLPGTAVSGKPLGSSPIAIAYHGQASSLSLSDSTYFKNHEVTSFTLSNSIVAMMVDHVVTILTGIKDTGKAWESLFPAGSLTAQTTVGIKINNTVGWDRGNQRLAHQYVSVLFQGCCRRCDCQRACADAQRHVSSRERHRI